jgi:hypothetical protein
MRPWRLFASILLLCLPARLDAAIARTGQCSATATSCTLSAVTSGDLVVIFAFRSGSTTAPSADSSGDASTTITSTATAASGTVASFRTSCHKASSGADTTSGTYTNATAVVAIAFSGTAVGTTGNCNTTGIGGTSTTNAKTSTTASYNTVTMSWADSTSWVAGFLGGTGSSTCTPSGMTSESAIGTVRGSDSEGVLNSWATTTCAVSSETWMSAVVEIIAAGGPYDAAQTPTLVQHVSTGVDTRCCRTSPAPATVSLQVAFPQATLAGNFLVIAVQVGDSVNVSSVTDDHSNQWHGASTTCDDGTSKDRLQLWYANNAAAGTVQVTVSFSGNNTFIGADLSEFYNVAAHIPLDVSTQLCSDATSPYQPGSMTTTAAHDLIWLMGTSFGGGAGTLSAITAGTAGSGFTKLASDLNGAGQHLGTLSEYQVWSTSGAINPDFSTTGDTTARWGIVAGAFKAASQGTAPSATPRIVHVAHRYIGQTGAAGTVAPEFASSGNLIVGLLNAGSVGSVTAVTDSASNAWTVSAGCSTVNTNGGGTRAQVLYAANATTSATLNAITLTMSGTLNDPFVVFYDIIGAAASPFDVCVVGTGNQASFGTLTGDTITPARSGGVVFSNVAIEWHDVQASGVGVFDKAVLSGLDNDPGDGGTGPSEMDEDNGNAHVYPTNTSPITFTWTANGNELTCYPAGCGNPTGMGQWASVTVSFVPAAAGSSCVPRLSTLGVSSCGEPVPAPIWSRHR